MKGTDLSIKRIVGLVALIVVGSVALAGCSSEADTASHNLSKAADNFEIQRRIVFINGITDNYLLTVEGRCSLGNSDVAGELSVTCKIGEAPNGDGIYKKHFLGLSDNTTYVVEQLDGAAVDPFHYRIMFRPETLVPDVDLQTSE